MSPRQIVELQERVGTTPDGFWGPRSAEACRQHLFAMMPRPSPWPAADDKSMRSRYGAPNDEKNLTRIDVTGLGIKYQGQPVRSLHCHRLVAASLLSILREIASGPHASVLGQYAGCYAPRNMRGGSRPSKHAWGVAVDLDPDNNGLRMAWPTGSKMPLDVMEVFARHGWTSAGAFWGRDAMHFEAVQPW
jgi:hypothetical protein